MLKKEKPMCRNANKIIGYTGELDKSPERIVEEFFGWMKEHTPLVKFFEKANEENIKSGSEIYPFDFFEACSKAILLKFMEEGIPKDTYKCCLCEKEGIPEEDVAGLRVSFDEDKRELCEVDESKNHICMGCIEAIQLEMSSSGE